MLLLTLKAATTWHVPTSKARITNPLSMYSSFQGKVVKARIPCRQPSCVLFKGSQEEQKSLLRMLISPRTLERVAVVAVLLIFPMYVALSFERNGGGAPTLTVEGDSAGTTVHTPFATLRGATSPSAQLFINNGPVLLHDNGTFEEKLALQHGINTIELVARRYGMATKLTRTIIYNP